MLERRVVDTVMSDTIIQLPAEESSFSSSVLSNRLLPRSCRIEVGEAVAMEGAVEGEEDGCVLG